MGVVRRGAFLAIAAAACAAGVSASVASCTFGDYDGSFDSAGLEVGTGLPDGAVSPPSSGTVDPSSKMDTTVKSSDNVFTIVVPPGAYDAPVTITITPLGERVLGPTTTFTVPRYAVTITNAAAANLPVQVVFVGNAPNVDNGTNAGLAPAVESGNALTLLPIVADSAAGAGTNSETAWGLTKNIAATFTLTLAPNIAPGNPNTLVDPSSANCIYDCCGINKPGSTSGGGGNAQLHATDVGCACAGANPTTAVDCFAQKCADLGATAQRCLDLGIEMKLDGGGPACPGAMGPGSTNCNPNNDCCYQPGTMNGGFSCGSGGGAFNCTYVARCSNDAQCASGVCCAYDDEAICSTACPSNRRVCAKIADAGAPECNGGACTSGGKCGIATCGATPAFCQ